MVLNKFRQAVFNEYVELCRMCERAEIPLTEEILKRGRWPSIGVAISPTMEAREPVHWGGGGQLWN